VTISGPLCPRSRRRAHVSTRPKVEWVFIGFHPLYRAGSTISVVVNRNGQLITIEAMYNRNGSLLGGEQSVIAEGAVISDIYAFGRDAR
jgi:hypothetical protein